MKLVALVKKHSIVVLISFISTLLIVNVLLIFHNKSIIVKNNTIMHESEEISYQTNQLVGYTLHNLDLGIRAYGIVKDDVLYGPAAEAIGRLDEKFDKLKASLIVHGYEVSPVEELRKTYHGYVDFIEKMKQAAAIDSMATFRKMLGEDRGLQVFLHWNEVGNKILKFETDLKAKAEGEYQSAIDNNLYLQIVILLLGLPTLTYVVFKIRNDERNRFALITELEENNRKYIFNPGAAIQINDPKQVIENSILNFQQASEFIENISDGKYTAEWKELNEENMALNETNLAGRLTNMREQLKQMKREEERRLWTNEGLTRFSETVRNHQNNLVELSHEVVRFLTRYMNAQQGGLFVLREGNNDAHLELIACYAFDRKKFIERRIEIGSGLIGQTYLEGETTLLTKLPQGYTYITSGMGEATPGSLVIVPMKYNGKTEAMIEIASLEKFEDHQIAFLEKAGEFVASALQSVRTTEKMHELLTASQRQTEEMRATEEEMRQNLEELQATQEAMVRKQEELDQMHEEESERAKKIAESNQQETNMLIEKLKATEAELRKLKTGGL